MKKINDILSGFNKDHGKKVKILVVTPFGKDSNSMYRSIGPWSYLAKQSRKYDSDLDFEFDVAGEDTGHRGIAWDVIGKYDLVFLHRPCRDDDLTILRIARQMNIPVWSEFDDWLFEVPVWNPHSGQYANHHLQNIIATCVAASDIVSVTTAPLYDKFKIINPNVVIIPNAYRSDLYPYRDENPKKRDNIIAWRGTNTHDADILSVGEAWFSLPGKLNFYGGLPWILGSKMDPSKTRVIAPQDPFLYMKDLYMDSPRVLVVPLVDCFFNRCKSNIAYQEAVHAGAVCVAPDMPEWNRPGIINFEPGNPLSFSNAVSNVFNMPDEKRNDLAKYSYDEMRKEYDISVVNEKRKEVLFHALSSDLERNDRNPWDPLLGLWAMGQFGLKKTQNKLKDVSIG